MSKNIIIQTDGTPETYNDTPRIRTIGIGSGRIGWIPYSETQTGTIAINKNGTYRASDKGLMGFSRAVVKVPSNSVTGKKADGNDYTVTTDTDGYIVETKVPSEIRVTTPPDYTGPYHGGVHAIIPGDPIDFTGLVVTAYDAEGQSMGEVPFNELIFPVTHADYYAGHMEEHEGTATYNGTTITWCQPKSIYHSFGDDGKNVYGYATVESWGSPVYAFTILSQNSIAQYVVCERNFTGTYRSYDGSSATLKVSQTPVDGTYYYYALIGGSMGRDYQNAEWYPSENAVELGDAIRCLYNGTITDPIEGQTIPVQWPRTGDGALLETSFTVSVVPGTGN